jgi:hypothetical protein
VRWSDQNVVSQSGWASYEDLRRLSNGYDLCRRCCGQGDVPLRRAAQRGRFPKADESGTAEASIYDRRWLGCYLLACSPVKSKNKVRNSLALDEQPHDMTSHHNVLPTAAAVVKHQNSSWQLAWWC